MSLPSVCQDLQVMKSRRPGVGVICFVAKLNRSSAALPQAVLNAEGTVSMQLSLTDLKHATVGPQRHVALKDIIYVGKTTPLELEHLDFCEFLLELGRQ